MLDISIDHIIFKPGNTVVKNMIIIRYCCEEMQNQLAMYKQILLCIFSRTFGYHVVLALQIIYFISFSLLDHPEEVNNP